MGVVAALRTLAGGLPTRTRTAVVVAGSLLVAGAAAIGTVGLYRALFDHAAPPEIGDYLPAEYGAALRWLDEQTAPEDVVLASLSIAPMIPGSTGCTVFAGHWAQTIDPQQKAEFIAALFGAPEDLNVPIARRILARNRVRYIVLDRLSREIEEIPRDRRTFGFAPLAEIAYENDFVTIWRVTVATTSVPWDGGDWRAPAPAQRGGGASS